MTVSSHLLFFAHKGITGGQVVGIIENDHCLPIALKEARDCSYGLRTAWKKALDTESFFIDTLHLTHTPTAGFWVYVLNYPVIGSVEEHLSTGQIEKASQAVLKEVMSQRNGWIYL